MDRYAVYNVVTSILGVGLAIVFFGILLGKIDVVNILDNQGVGHAFDIFGMHFRSAQDAQNLVADYLPEAAASGVLDAKIAAMRFALGGDIGSGGLYPYSSFRYHGGHCVRLGLVDDATTKKIPRTYVFVDEAGHVVVENSC